MLYASCTLTLLIAAASIKAFTSSYALLAAVYLVTAARRAAVD